MNRVDFQKLADIRLQEAKALLAAGFPEGAYYLAGYSVECALKACIAKRTQQHDFPDKKQVSESHTHSLIELMRLSQLAPMLKLAMQEDSKLEDNWITVQIWSESSRYQIREIEDAILLVEAIEVDAGGILSWIKLHW